MVEENFVLKVKTDFPIQSLKNTSFGEITDIIHKRTADCFKIVILTSEAPLLTCLSFTHVLAYLGGVTVFLY